MQLLTHRRHHFLFAFSTAANQQGDAYNRGDEANEMGGNLPAANLGTNVVPIDLVTGMDFVCALTTAGAVKCWGRNCNGQGGFGDIETYGDDPDEMGDNLPFVDLGSERSATAITAGDAHVCALLDDGSVKCWGKGYYGQTGLEEWNSMGQVPGQMGDALPALDLGTSATSNTTTAARKLGGRGLRRLQAAETSTAVSVDNLSAGGQRSCAIVDGGSVKVRGVIQWGLRCAVAALFFFWLLLPTSAPLRARRCQCW